MSSTLKSRIINGLSANIIGQAVNVIIQLVSIPVFIAYWGTGLYGEWLILSAIPAYFALSDIGLSSVAANDMTIKMAKGLKNEALSVYQSTWVLISFISLGILVLELIFLFSIGQQYLPKLEYIPIEYISYIIIALTAYVLLSLQGSILSAGFRSNKLYAFAKHYNNFARLFEFIIIMALIQSQYSPLEVAFAYFFVKFITITGMLIVLKIKIPWLSLGGKHASYKKIRNLFKPAIAFMAFPLGNAISIQGFIILIGSILGPVAVVTFTTLRTVTRIAIQAMGIINNTLWPEISSAFGANNLKLARKLHLHACQASLALSFISIIVLYFIGDWLLTTWTGGRVLMNQPLFNTLLLVIISNSFWFTSSVVMVAINKHQRMAVMYLLGTTLSIISAYYFVSYYGLNAAAISLLLTDVFMIIVVLPNSLRILNEDFGGFLKSMFCTDIISVQK